MALRGSELIFFLHFFASHSLEEPKQIVTIEMPFV